jgi:hypothetical protein
MTVVAIWYEPHDNAAWIVADTRVVGTVGTLTESAAKIFPLTVRCFQPGPTGDFDQLVYSTTIGFAFAGSTLPALMLYSVANAFLQHLISVPNVGIPALSDVAATLQRIAELYLTETMRTFEFAILGWCATEARYAAFHVKPDDELQPRHMVSVPFDLYERDAFLLLGNRKAQVSEIVRGVFTELQGQPLRRAPKIALQRIVQSGDIPEVGGSLQIGTANQLGFILKTMLRPIGPNGPQAELTFLGISVDGEIGRVGNYRVGMMGTI